eukprot:3675682-Prymnesium_polylepis.1
MAGREREREADYVAAGMRTSRVASGVRAAAACSAGAVACLLFAAACFRGCVRALRNSIQPCFLNCLRGKSLKAQLKSVSPLRRATTEPSASSVARSTVRTPYLRDGLGSRIGL